MAATYTIDQLTNLSMIERRSGNTGVVFELRREALVSGLDADTLQDYRVLQEALDTVGLVIGDALIGHDDLILVERVPHLIPGERTKCRVELVFKRRFSTLDTVELDTFIPRGGSGLRQFTTPRDQFGNDIKVCYTYPAKCMQDPPIPPPDMCGQPGQAACCEEEPGYPFTDPRLAGELVCLGGEVQVDYPSDTLEFEGRLISLAPGEIARKWRGHTNMGPGNWNGGAPGTWRCTEVSFYPYDIAPDVNKVWVFNFLFQFDPTGWNPDAIFRNQLTGMPPPDIDDHPGAVIEVDWYPTLNFHALFPS